MNLQEFVQLEARPDYKNKYFLNETVLVFKYFLVFITTKGKLLKRFNKVLSYNYISLFTVNMLLLREVLNYF